MNTLSILRNLGLMLSVCITVPLHCMDVKPDAGSVTDKKDGMQAAQGDIDEDGDIFLEFDEDLLTPAPDNWDPELDKAKKVNSDKQAQPENKPKDDKKDQDEQKDSSRVDADNHSMGYITPTAMQVKGIVIGGVVVTGLWYLLGKSSIKQIADLRRLELYCNQAIDEIGQSKKRDIGTSIESVYCSGLDNQLQDRLDESIALYALSIQHLRSAIRASRNIKPVDLQEYISAKNKLTICKQVIAECRSFLDKNPSALDRVVITAAKGVKAIKRTYGTLKARGKKAA